MQQFEITLKNEKSGLYDRLAIFIFILNGIGIGFFLYSSYSTIIDNSVGIVALILALIAILFYIFSSNVSKKKYTFLFCAIAAALYWLLIGYWWAGILMLLLFFSFAISKRQLKVSFNHEGISYPSFPKRMIKWNELNNSILKDGLLTIDFKDNKLIQQHADKRNKAIDEKEFNEFCTQQLKSASAI